jgi:thioredoxin 1
MVYPIVIELANHYGKKVNIGKMNVDLEQEKINNRSIPPILIFKDGEVVDKHLGVLSKRTLKKKIDDFLYLKDFSKVL